MDVATIRRRVISGFAWEGLTKLFVQTMSWVSTFVVARILVPSDYGLMAAASVFTGLLLFITEMGLSQGLIQRKETTIRLEEGVFYVSLAASLIAYACLFVAAPYIAAFYEMPTLRSLLRIAGIGIVLGGLATVPRALVMRQLNYRYRSLVHMAAELAGVATVISLALLGYGVWSLVGAFLVNNGVLAVGFLPLLRRIPRPSFAAGETLSVVAYGMNITANRFMNYLWTHSDAFILAKLLGERLLGYYSMALQLAVLPLDKVGTIFNHVVFPAVARLQEHPEETRRLFVEVHKYLLLIGLPVLVGLALVANDAVILVLTEKWAPIVPVLQGLCLVNIARISSMILPAVLYGRGKPILVTYYNTGMLLLLPAAFWILTERFGLIGAVYAWAGVFPMFYTVLVALTLKELGLSVRRFVQSAWPAMVCTMSMALAVTAVQTQAEDWPRLARLGASIAIGVTTYAAVFAFVFRGQLRTVLERVQALRRGDALNEIRTET